MAKTTPLLRVRRGNSSEGSNPSRSAIFFMTLPHPHSFYMAVALEEAQKASEKDEVPVGAVIVDETGVIIAKTHNLRESHHCATAHAELLAIQEACLILKRWRLYNCTLYVTLEPCYMCAGAILLARIPTVVFGALDPKAGAVMSLDRVLQNKKLNHSCHIEHGVLAEECSIILKNFFKKRRKKKL